MHRVLGSGVIHCAGEAIDKAVVSMNAARGAAALSSLGLAENDAVATLLRNDTRMFEVQAAAAQLGLYYVPINWHFKHDEAGYILADSGAKALIVHADLLDQVKDGIPQGVAVIAVPTPDFIRDAYPMDVAASAPPAGASVWGEWIAGFDPWDKPPRPERGIMSYTSGTTGRPKGVVKPPMTEDQVATAQAVLTKAYGTGPDRRFLLTGPSYHIAVNHSCWTVLVADDDVVVMTRFEAEEFLALVDRHRVTHTHMVPTMFHRLLKLPETVRARYDVSSMRHVSHGAAPCAIDVKRAMIDWFGPVFMEYYGGTENGLTHLCPSEEWLTHPGSVGRPTEGARVRIYDSEGSELGPGEVGEVYAYSPMIPDFTYRGMEEKRRAVERDGLITLGDLGYQDEDGYLYLCDRINDMVISGGVNIYPAEIEAALITLDGVRDCAVFGIPHDEFGEVLHAVIQPADGATVTAEGISDFLAGRLAGYKVPRSYEFRDALPREDTGKIFKRKLRDPFWSETGRKI